MTKKRLFGITGWKNSGKTHLVANLISEFKKRGLTVSTIKHAHHSFDIDHENTDTWQHRKAGAGEVAIVSKNRWALMHEIQNAPEPKLQEIVQKLAPCDIVLIEGYKSETHPKIETIRSNSSDNIPLWQTNNTIIAIASDTALDNCNKPIFMQDNIPQIADFILSELGLVELDKETQNDSR